MERKKTVNDLYQIRNVFVHAVCSEGLDVLIKSLPSVNFISTISSRQAVMNSLDKQGIFNRLIDLEQYNMDKGSDGFKAFSKRAFTGVLSEEYSSNDQFLLNKTRVKAIDLVIVNFGDKKILDFNHDDLSALFMLIAGINNYARVAVLSDKDDYQKFLELLSNNENMLLEKIASEKTTSSSSNSRKGSDAIKKTQNISPCLKISERFHLAKKSASYLKDLFGNSFLSLNFSLEKDKFELFNRSDILEKELIAN